MCTLLISPPGLTHSHGGAVHAAYSAQVMCWFNVFVWWCHHRATVIVMYHCQSSKFDMV